jgi:phenylacetate-coenzyme A ligase PaaK-like adenylate-forming protein
LHLDASLPVNVLVQRLNEWQPEMLILHPSVGRALAEEQMSGQLRISPQLIFTCGEILSDPTRQQLETAWGKRLFNQYAAPESGGLGAECDHHMGIHLFDDLVITEVVDEHDRPVPPGIHGDKVLVTVLYKRSQPLIRYEINDRLRVAAAPCLCGRPYRLIDKLQEHNEKAPFPLITGSVPLTAHPNAPHWVMPPLPVSG